MNGGGVFARRLCRLLPPYIVWSLAYSLLLSRSGVLGAIKELLTAGAAAHVYFIAVYLQLTLITPLLYRLLRRFPLFAYAITPLSLVAYEVLTVAGVVLPFLGRLFPMWLIFYVVGLDWERWSAHLQGRTHAAIFALCVCLTVQLAAGFMWGWFGDYNMATSQLKLSSMATSLCVIAVIMLLPAAVKRRLSESFLADLGDVSFGVYLCHILVLAVMRKVISLFVLPPLLGTVLIFPLTLGLSWSLCVIVHRALSRKFARVLGMA